VIALQRAEHKILIPYNFPDLFGLTVDKFAPSSSGIGKVRSRTVVDAASQPVARFKNGNLQTCRG